MSNSTTSTLKGEREMGGRPTVPSCLCARAHYWVLFRNNSTLFPASSLFVSGLSEAE